MVQKTNSVTLNNYCFECRKRTSNIKKHVKKIKHKCKLYRTNYDQLCHYCNCMKNGRKNGYCDNHKEQFKPSKFKTLLDVRCPVCKGAINNKWFNFRTGNVIEFIAECWSGDLDVESQKHIFYFQIEAPDADSHKMLFPAKGSKVS